jgi:hypothetical protein
MQFIAPDGAPCYLRAAIRVLSSFENCSATVIVHTEFNNSVRGKRQVQGILCPVSETNEGNALVLFMEASAEGVKEIGEVEMQQKSVDFQQTDVIELPLEDDVSNMEREVPFDSVVGSMEYNVSIRGKRHVAGLFGRVRIGVSFQHVLLQVHPI